MNQLIVNDNLSPDIAIRLATFEQMVKSVKEQEEELKEAIKAEMEARGILKLETPEISIRYVEQTDVESFDKNLFKKENPDLYDEYITMKPRASYITIKVKGE